MMRGVMGQQSSCVTLIGVHEMHAHVCIYVCVHVCVHVLCVCVCYTPMLHITHELIGYMAQWMYTVNVRVHVMPSKTHRSV